MSRKRESDVGSMELLTDSICDIFGLFCFLVILLALLSTIQGGGEATVIEATPELRTSDALAQEAVRLEQQLESLSDPGRDQKLAELETQRLVLERSKRRQAEFERRESGVTQELRVDPEQVNPLKSMIPSLDSEVKRLQAELLDAQARSEIAMALPRITESSATSSFIIILTGGRLYVVQGKGLLDSSIDWCKRLASFDEFCVDISKSSVDCGGGTFTQTIVLRLENGIDVSDAMWTESPMWKEWWSWIGPAPVVVSLIVDPDSFREFASVRRFLSQHGKRYYIHPEIYGDHFTAKWSSGRPAGQ